MKNLIVLLTMLITPFLSFTQDENLERELTKEVFTCERIATNSHQLIGQLALTDLDKTRKILSNWELECGSLEPVVRMNVLLDIYQGKSFDDWIEYQTCLNTFDIYRRKMYLAENDYYGTYENNKGYYGYVPLHSEFDALTLTIAEEILQRDSLTNTERLIALHYSNQFDEFEELYAKTDNLFKNYNQKIRRENVKRAYKYSYYIAPQIGIQSYLGGISSKANFSGYLGLKAGLRIDKWRIGFDTRLQLYNAKDSIPIVLDNEELSFKPIYSFQMGGELSRQVWLSENEKMALHVNVGGAYLETDSSYKKYNEAEEKSETVYVSAYQLSLGTSLDWTLKNSRHMALQFNYLYMNFNRDEYVKGKLDGHGFSLGTIYNF